jgi:GntR family transcriptional repressor for pyruvate dehydrogenase complex
VEAVSDEPKPLLEAINQRRLPDVIAEQVMEAIRAGVLKPGDRLPAEPALARQLGVGRTSVREGLQKLQALGLVRVVRGRGAFVTEPSVADAQQTFARWSAEHRFEIEDLQEMRMALEPVAAGLAAVRAGDAEVSELEGLHVEHLVAGREGDLGEAVLSDAHFHGALMKASRSPLLDKMYGILVAEVTEFRRKTLALPGAAERSSHGHSLILQAVRRRDAVGARAAMLDHLWVVYEEIDAAAARTEKGAARQAAPRAVFG